MIVVGCRSRIITVVSSPLSPQSQLPSPSHCCRSRHCHHQASPSFLGCPRCMITVAAMGFLLLCRHFSAIVAPLSLLLSLQSPSPSHPHVITVAVASSMSPFSRSPSLLPRRHFPPSLVLLSPQSPSPSLSHRITAVAAAFPLLHCHRFFAVRRRQGIIAAVHIIIASSLSCHRCCVVAVTVTLPLMHRRWRH